MGKRRRASEHQIDEFLACRREQKLQMLAASIRLICKYKGAVVPEATEYAAYIANTLQQTVAGN